MMSGAAPSPRWAESSPQILREAGFFTAPIRKIEPAGGLSGLEKFALHFEFFPAAFRFTRKWIGVKVVMVWLLALRVGIMDFLTDPHLPRGDV